MAEIYSGVVGRRVSDSMQVVFDKDELLVLKRDYDALQAQIDRLMLEYCPDEMTDEQFENWAKHQRPVEMYDGSR